MRYSCSLHHRTYGSRHTLNKLLLFRIDLLPRTQKAHSHALEVFYFANHSIEIWLIYLLNDIDCPFTCNGWKIALCCWIPDFTQTCLQFFWISIRRFSNKLHRNVNNSSFRIHANRHTSPLLIHLCLKKAHTASCALKHKPHIINQQHFQQSENTTNLLQLQLSMLNAA